MALKSLSKLGWMKLMRTEAVLIFFFAILLSLALAEEEVQEMEVEVDNQEFVVRYVLYG